MRKTIALLAGSLVAAATLISGSLAFADEPPTCADALTSFQDASKAADAALAADKAAAAAKAADEALSDAKAAVNDARTAALSAGLTDAELTATNAAALRKARADILAKPEPRAEADVIALAKIEKQLPLIDAVLAAQVKLVAATSLADATDADALRRTANLTDVDVLVKKAIDLRVVANDACKGTPGVTVTPLPPAPVVPIPTSIDSGKA